MEKVKRSSKPKPDMKSDDTETTETIEKIKLEVGEIKLDVSGLLSEEKLLLKLNEEDKKKLYSLESELYGNISTLDSITKNFEEGRVDPATFKRQLRSLMKGTFKAKKELEKIGLDVIEFIKNQGFLEEFTLALNKLKLTSSKDSIIYDIMLESPGRIASKTFNITSDIATILDLVKLRYNATYEMTLSLLNELQISFRNYPGFGSTHWIYEEIEQWKNKLNNKKLSAILDENTLTELENRITIWKNEFYSIIKEVSR